LTSYSLLDYRRSDVAILPPIRDAPPEVETLTMDQIEVKSYVDGLVK
jgi:hypothetical protein